jgi:N-glycosylase/DNA lyase
MPLDFAWQTFFAAIREAVASYEQPRQRLAELYTATLDKLSGNEPLREDIAQRITRLREVRARIPELSEREVRDLLAEFVSVYDAISADLYSRGTTKSAARV